MDKNSQHKIAILGGSGKAGTDLVTRCRENGFPIKLLLRNPIASLSNEKNVEMVIGDARNSEIVNKFLAGCDSVISVIGSRKGEQPLQVPVTKNILEAMRLAGIKRYIVVTGITIAVPGDKKRWQTRWNSALAKLLFPTIIADKQQAFEILANSALDWTVVRIPYLLPQQETGLLQIDVNDCRGKTISGYDLADFLIKQIDDRDFIRKAPFVSS